MAVSKAQQAAVHKYVKNNYARIEITVKKEMKPFIEAAAKANNENATNESKIVTTSLIFLCFKPLAPILKAFFKGNLDLISLKSPFL